jgi:ATP-dependent Clp protease ATP-binding subunit ClpX
VLGILDELDEAALIDILTKPRNAILKQYAKLFDYEGVKVTWTDDAARRLRARRCSARSAHAVCA